MKFTQEDKIYVIKNFHNGTIPSEKENNHCISTVVIFIQHVISCFTGWRVFCRSHLIFFS